MKKLLFIASFILFQSCTVEKEYRLNIKYDNIEGLTKKSSVESKGMEIGSVEKMQLVKDGVIVTVSINNSVSIPKNSSFFLKEKGLLGDKFIDIVFDSISNTNYKENDTVNGELYKFDNNQLKKMIKISKIGNVSD